MATLEQSTQIATLLNELKADSTRCEAYNFDETHRRVANTLPNWQARKVKLAQIVAELTEDDRTAMSALVTDLSIIDIETQTNHRTIASLIEGV